MSAPLPPPEPGRRPAPRFEPRESSSTVVWLAAAIGVVFVLLFVLTVAVRAL